MFYDSGTASLFMLVYWLLSNERVDSISYLENPRYAISIACSCARTSCIL